MKSLFTFFLCLVICFSSTAQDKAKQIDDLLAFCYKKGLFNGTILVSDHGNVIYDKAWGYADFAAQREMKTESTFYLASVSKQFTCMAIMILQEQGKLSYDDPLSKYFSDFPDYADQATLRHMMHHTSGIPDHYSLGLNNPGLKNKDVYDLLVQQDTLLFEPGAQYSYSNGAYTLLSMIVAKVSGQSFAQFMKANIFEPLGMTNTLVFDETNPTVTNRVVGHTAFGNTDDYQLFTTGAGGMFTTTGDLYKWDRALYTEKLVKQSTLAEAFEPTILNDGEVVNYGFGWNIQSDSLGKRVFHTGGMAGFRTFLYRDMINNSTVIMLTNKGGVFPLGPLATALNNILRGKAYELPKIPITMPLYDLVEAGKLKRLGKTFHKLKKKKSDEYVISENALNAMGYLLIKEEKLEAAKAIFKVNIEAFPESANTYDSYAEACYLLGQYDQARLNYQKSLKLDPENDNAVEMLAKIEQKG